MKVHRFITPVSIDGTRISIVDPAVYHQAKRVLRLDAGEKIIVTDNTKQERLVTINSFDNHAIQGDIVSTDINTRETVTGIHLCVSLLKRENFEWVVQKATEVGVASIIPLICDRTIKLGIKADRLSIIAREAAEQCGRSTVPTIGEPVAFRAWLGGIDGATEHYFFDAGGQAVVRDGNTRQPVYGYVGPEGGWSDGERQAAQQAGMRIVTLGTLMFRAETAAVIGSYVLMPRAV